jgi:hypothetical protein
MDDIASAEEGEGFEFDGCCALGGCPPRFCAAAAGGVGTADGVCICGKTNDG